MKTKWEKEVNFHKMNSLANEMHLNLLMMKLMGKTTMIMMKLHLVSKVKRKGHQILKEIKEKKMRKRSKKKRMDKENSMQRKMTFCFKWWRSYKTSSRKRIKSKKRKVKRQMMKRKLRIYLIRMKTCHSRKIT